MWGYTLLFGLQMIMFAPTASSQRSVTAKLHHPVTLTCDWRCSDVLKWSNKFQKTVAQCDQSSCRSVEGFNISHGQYLEGKPYLTITAADYSDRGTYTCQCDGSDVCDVRLIIQTEVIRCQVTPGDPIDVHLPLTELVAVSFTASDAEQPPNLQICTVDKDKIHCSPDYTERASRVNTLQIKDGTFHDSGSYTVQDLVNDQTLAIIQVDVRDQAVSGVQSRGCRSISESWPECKQEGGVPAWGAVLIVLLVLVTAAFVALAVMFLRLRRELQQLHREHEENRPMNGNGAAH